MKRYFNLRPLPTYIITSVLVALVCGSTVLLLIFRNDESADYTWLAILPAAVFLLWSVLTAMVYARIRKRYDKIFMDILSTFPKEDVEAFMEYTERLPEDEEIARWVCGKLESYERARFNNMAALSGVSMSREIFWRISKHSNRVDFGQYWENTYGLNQLGNAKDIRLLLEPATRDEFNDCLQRIAEGEEDSFTLYGKLDLSSEKNVSVFIQGRCVKIPATGEKVFMGSVCDIDMETRLSEKYKTEKQKSRFLLSACTDVFYEVSVKENRLRALNPKAAKELFNMGDMMDFDGQRRPYWAMIHPDDREGFVDRFFNYDHMAIMPEQKMLHEYRIKNREGEYIWVEHQAQALTFDENGKVTKIIGRISDITAIKRNQLKQRTNIDALTGAMLRTSVTREFENRINAGDRCVVLVNINGFHFINNQYGYETGDMVLRHVVTVLWENQQGRCVVGRMDADTFVVAMVDVNEKNTPQKMINKMFAAFEQPINVDGRVVNIAVCASCSGVFKAGCTFDEAYEQAELAMKISKQNATAYTNIFTEYTDSMQTADLQEQLNEK